MSLLFKIVYAAHANGSHHKLALDALDHLACVDAYKWQRLFLRHAEIYLDGSKKPDTEFKDFKNHVLHVGDQYWGGAPEKARSWYGMLVAALGQCQWSEAVFAAGILSHYYTDPLHPFHTAQSEAENSIHRACEWSISKSYDNLRKIGQAETATVDEVIRLGNSPRWLEELVCQGAERSHKHYAKLIAHYDIHRGVVDPPAGLDPIAQKLIGELIVYAGRSFALVLERAFAEARVDPPEVSLTAETLLAALKIPAKWVLKKIADGEDRRQVERMYDELLATGTVETSLPDDDRMVRDLHAREVLAPAAVRLAASRAERLPAPSRVHAVEFTPAIRAIPPPASAAGRDGSLSRRLVEREGFGEPADRGQTHEADPTTARPTSVPTVPAAANVASMAAHRGQTHGSDPIEPRRIVRMEGSERASVPKPKRARGAPAAERPPPQPGDPVEAAPSIGPKTAARLLPAGIVTVADLLAADPIAAAKAVGARHIKAETIREWQQQTRLLLAVPDLKVGHVQLLVGAGFPDVDAIATADPPTLLAGVLRYCQTSDGQRILKTGEVPDLERIMAWIALVAAARAA